MQGGQGQPITEPYANEKGLGYPDWFLSVTLKPGARAVVPAGGCLCVQKGAGSVASSAFEPRRSKEGIGGVWGELHLFCKPDPQCKELLLHPTEFPSTRLICLYCNKCCNKYKLQHFMGKNATAFKMLHILV